MNRPTIILALLLITATFSGNHMVSAEEMASIHKTNAELSTSKIMEDNAVRYMIVSNNDGDRTESNTKIVPLIAAVAAAAALAGFITYASFEMAQDVADKIDERNQDYNDGIFGDRENGPCGKSISPCSDYPIDWEKFYADIDKEKEDGETEPEKDKVKPYPFPDCPDCETPEDEEKHIRETFEEWWNNGKDKSDPKGDPSDTKDTNPYDDDYGWPEDMPDVVEEGFDLVIEKLKDKYPNILPQDYPTVEEPEDFDAIEEMLEVICIEADECKEKIKDWLKDLFDKLDREDPLVYGDNIGIMKVEDDTHPSRIMEITNYNTGETIQLSRTLDEGRMIFIDFDMNGKISNDKELMISESAFDVLGMFNTGDDYEINDEDAVWQFIKVYDGKSKQVLTTEKANLTKIGITEQAVFDDMFEGTQQYSDCVYQGELFYEDCVTLHKDHFRVLSYSWVLEDGDYKSLFGVPQGIYEGN